ncbi:MAG TPA: saccharopine dehydrogenase [Actinophytocola sp.]|nr:saccharopine dehydrogenase [Actinophytocola sp.]
MNATSVWLRAETRPTERRAPLVPDDARRLVAAGVPVTVEDSPRRCFPIGEYEIAGCDVAEEGAWVGAPTDAIVLGLKELPDSPATLRHTHVFFGHAFKRQPGAARLLRRFRDGGGTLLDLEYLVDAEGRRLAAFGYWAGYLGAALAVLHVSGTLTAPLTGFNRDELDAALARVAGTTGLATLVTGALGRSGRGARDALAVAGVVPTCWDLDETRDLDKGALLAHDVLVNAVLASGPTQPFVDKDDVADPARRLTTIADVSCDVGGAYNVLPIYDSTTSWTQPVRRLWDIPPLDLIAIDNLPSLLAVEASTDFSAQLAPLLPSTGQQGSAWDAALASFRSATKELVGD